MTPAGKFGWVLAGAALLISIANPATATHSAEHANQQIDQIVKHAVADMAARVDVFERRVQTATTKSEIESLRKAARADINDLWAEAKSEVEKTGKGYNSELSQEIAEAKRVLVAAKNAALREIDKAAAAATQGLAEPTTTTTAAGTTTTAPVAGTTTPPEPDADPPPTLTPLERWASEAFVTGGSEAGSGDASSSTASRSGIAVALETVLPPDLIDWAVSPFLILMVILRTTLSGGASILFPAAALAIAAAVLVVLEARSRRIISRPRR